MCLLDLYFKTFLILFLDWNIEKKKIFNLLIINGEQHKEAKKVERSKPVEGKNKDLRIQVEL